ncbi:carbon-nitrogen hydrolase family protein [Halomonas sp. V046]|uniref:carbon-nitrogen hydrolase family protein n=1 Tax=Halomonas sp. V046 TaxID=3459611 RepID=UPI004044026B
MKPEIRVAVVQDSSVPFDAAATTQKCLRLIEEASGEAAELVVFPEAFLGTYPKGMTFDAPVGTRLPEGRDDYLRYYDGAIDMAGPELAEIEKSAGDNNVFVVIGIIERGGATLYCTVVFIDPVRGIIGKRRKLMPTGSERLVWGFGDGSTLDVVDCSLGKVGAVICWENYMPALRAVMYDQGIELYCAPTADSRDTWLPSMQHIAMEGRCYVLSACQYLRRGDFDDEYRCVLSDDPDYVLMRGGSVIVGPLGEVVAGPIFDRSCVIYANIDRASLVKSKLDFDAVGHYARPDVLSVRVDREAKKPVL